MSMPWFRSGSVHRLLKAMTILLIALAAAAPAFAQVNTATIQVVVIDNNNQPLPGVTVRVTNTATGLDQTAVTEAQGTARLAALPPGTYTINFELQGFAPLVEKDVALRVGQNLVVNATMQTKLAETVTVTAAAPIVDVHKTDTSTNILPEQIEALPVADRDFQRLSFIAPTVQRERGAFRFVTGGPVIGSGGNASQGVIVVDGVDFTDPALGLAITRFSQDAIQEFRVIANRYDTEVGGVAGGALSIVTRAGTNTTGGKVFGFFRDKSLRSMSVLEKNSNQPEAGFSRQQFGGVLGGAVVKDKTHYFLSFEQIDDNSIALVRPQGAYVANRLDATYPTRQSLLFGRLDENMSDTQRLAGKFVYERYRLQNFRVGGVADVAQGLHLNRDNFNGNVEHTWVGGASKLNQMYLQVGHRKYAEPANTPGGMAVWFSSGNSLQTGGSIYEGMLGDGTYFELRDTFTLSRGAHDLKMGGEWQYLKDRYLFNTYPNGLLIYYTDTTALPLSYVYGVGSADSTINTHRLAGFVQDDWALRTNVKLNVGLRYDIDTNGNNPGFVQPKVWPNGSPRPRDTNNFQPRGTISWDLDGSGANVVRAGVGLFSGRFLLVPPHQENQQNGITGRLTYTRINGLFLGLPAAYYLNPADPQHTGYIATPPRPDIALLAQDYIAPRSTQASAGWTSRLGTTGMFFDTEVVYAKGTDEVALTDTNWSGNATHLRPNTSYNQINTYTNAGRSSYKAWVMSLNGSLKGGHVVTLSYTLASKKNISDDFSPEFPSGYPNDPANLDAEYGRSRSDERHRVVATAMLRAPYGLTVAPVFEYGSGQPWTLRLGYDYNGDGKNSDRPAGEPRFGQNGPAFKQLSLRVTKNFKFAAAQSLDVIFEVFNLGNITNYNVAFIDGAQYLSGPTIANPAAAYVANKNFKNYSAVLPTQEVQLGLRFTF